MDKGEVTLLTSYKWQQGLADVIWSGQGRSQGVRLAHQDNVKTSHYRRNPLGYHTSRNKIKIMRDNEECYDQGGWWNQQTVYSIHIHKTFGFKFQPPFNVLSCKNAKSKRIIF